MQWSNDKELFGQMRDVLHSAVIGDILDKMHYYHQFLPWRIQPLDKNMVVAGRAMTVSYTHLSWGPPWDSSKASSRPPICS